MFAIAIWDNRLSKLFLIRDRIGIKPLYYTLDHGRLLFASEIKSILSVRKRKPEVNEEALWEYLSFLTTPAEKTLFKDIYKVRPSEYLEINLKGNIEKKQYYCIWDNTIPELYQANDEEIKEAILNELQISVNYRKESDVPIGVFLSGGIDSSANAALFSSDGKSVDTFSVGYDKNYQSYKNELDYARLMADYCHANYHERILKEDDLFDFLKTMVYLQDEPIGDPCCFPIYNLSKLAIDSGVKVVQVGEGSDELFWGYETWKEPLKLANLNDIPGLKPLKKLMLYFLNNSGRGYWPYAEYLRRSISDEPIFWSGATCFMEHDKQSITTKTYRNRLKGYNSFEPLRATWREFNEKAWNKSNLNWMSYVDLRHRIPELLLARIDRMSMGVGLECRVPFLDHKFVEIAMSINPRKKTKDNNNKAVLKHALRGVIPDEIIDRRKQGFGVPIYDWLNGRLGAEMKDTVNQFVRDTDYFDIEGVQNIINNSSYSAQTWYLYNLALWWNEYIL